MDFRADGFARLLIAEILIGVLVLLVIVGLIGGGIGWVSRNVSVKVNPGPSVSIPDLIDEDGSILVQTIDGTFIRVRIK